MGLGFTSRCEFENVNWIAQVIMIKFSAWHFLQDYEYLVTINCACSRQSPVSVTDITYAQVQGQLCALSTTSGAEGDSDEKTRLPLICWRLSGTRQPKHGAPPPPMDFILMFAADTSSPGSRTWTNWVTSCHAQPMTFTCKLSNLWF